MNIILSILFSLTTNTCEPVDPTGIDEYAPDADAIEVDGCGAPLCVFNDGVNPPITKDCDNSCSWTPGSAVVCGEWTCSPIAPASACRWSCVLT